MKKRVLNILIAGVLGICIFTGCQKAPEASADNDVSHAKSSLENEVEAIAADEPDGDTARADGSYDALVGTEENGIWICAEVPAVPQTVRALTLRERDDWDEEKLKKLLDSEGGNVQDITAEYLAQAQKEIGRASCRERVSPPV